MKDAGDMEITFVGQLPQDDMSKMSMAQIAREGQTPLLPDIFIRDKILGLQDTDNMEDSIKEQQAERSLPEAALWTLLSAAEERGRPDLAQFYYGELMHLMNQRTLERQQAEMALQQAEQAQQQATLGGGGEGIGTTGVPPQVRPNAMTGAPPPTPNPQAAAFVPPGTPRPGAQTEEERLTREGLGPEGEI